MITLDLNTIIEITSRYVITRTMKGSESNTDVDIAAVSYRNTIFKSLNIVHGRCEGQPKWKVNSRQRNFVAERVVKSSYSFVYFTQQERLYNLLDAKWWLTRYTTVAENIHVCVNVVLKCTGHCETLVLTNIFSLLQQRNLISYGEDEFAKAGNRPVTGEFPSQKAYNGENVSIWWRHHGITALFSISLNCMINRWNSTPLYITCCTAACPDATPTRAGKRLKHVNFHFSQHV